MKSDELSEEQLNYLERLRATVNKTCHNNIYFYNVIMMIRTQVSLNAEEYEAAKQAAKEQGLSLAELLRRALRQLLPVKQTKPWMHYAGMAESGNPSSSQTIDDIVYGQKD